MKKKNKKMIMTIFISILLCLLTINVYLYLFNDSYSLSFSELFQKIADMPKIDTSFITLKFETAISSDWGVFNVIRDFINGIWQVVGVALYVCVQIINCAIYVFMLVKELFVGVLG